MNKIFTFAPVIQVIKDYTFMIFIATEPFLHSSVSTSIKQTFECQKSLLSILFIQNTQPF